MKIQEEVFNTLPRQFIVEDRLKIIFEGVVYTGVIASSIHVSISRNDNNIPLMAVYGPLYREKVELIYGHPTQGTWPCAKDIFTLNVLLHDMKQRGCLIELV